MPSTSDDDRRVLLVDDDRALLGSYKRILVRNGYNVVTADSAENAVRIAREQLFAVAIVDYIMPGKSGLQFLGELRGLQPACSRILVSGNLNLDSAINAVNEGHVSAVLQKPFGAERLLTTLEDAFGERARLWRQFSAKETQENVELRGQLAECFAGKALQLALQPIVDARTGIPQAYEALLRSSHERLCGPDQVLAAAEAYERIDDLADIVWDRAAGWLEKMPSEPKLFVNVHPTELITPRLIERRAHKLAPWASRIVIELTEQQSVLDLPESRRSLALLEECGFGLAVDDLGSGYSSLSLLADIRPQFIKIDMSIVRGIHCSLRKQRLVALLCRFADASGAQIIAEGIEVQEERDVLVESGAHLLQGYLLGRPSLRLEDVSPTTAHPLPLRPKGDLKCSVLQTS